MMVSLDKYQGSVLYMFFHQILNKIQGKKKDIEHIQQETEITELGLGQSGETAQHNSYIPHSLNNLLPPL